MLQDTTRITALVVSNDPELLAVVTDSFDTAGYSLKIAHNAEQCFKMLPIALPDLIVLDAELPMISGLYVANMVRRDSDVPIIMVSSCVEEQECVESLEIGAEDCVSKPLRAREFMLRVRNVLARHGKEAPQDTKRVATTYLPAIYKGEFVIDPNRHQIKVRGKNLRVPPIQFKLLHFLANHPDHVFSQDELLEQVWEEKSPHTKVAQCKVIVTMREVRKKIEEDPAEPKHLLTSRGIGYQFRF